MERRDHTELGRKLDHQHAHLLDIIERLKAMSAELDRLTASVAALKTKEQSLIALVKGLAQLIRDNVNNGPALTALADEIDADAGEMQAAVDENTPPTP
jgi:ABC-type transporter Mla subunit MlaD